MSQNLLLCSRQFVDSVECFSTVYVTCLWEWCPETLPQSSCRLQSFFEVWQAFKMNSVLDIWLQLPIKNAWQAVDKNYYGKSLESLASASCKCTYQEHVAICVTITTTKSGKATLPPLSKARIWARLCCWLLNVRRLCRCVVWCVSEYNFASITALLWLHGIWQVCIQLTAYCWN